MKGAVDFYSSRIYSTSKGALDGSGVALAKLVDPLGCLLQNFHGCTKDDAKDTGGSKATSRQYKHIFLLQQELAKVNVALNRLVHLQSINSYNSVKGAAWFHDAQTRAARKCTAEKRRLRLQRRPEFTLPLLNTDIVWVQQGWNNALR
jgi:hypothetical protein